MCALFVFISFFFAIVGAFKHPGLLHTADDFKRVVAKVNANTAPWSTGWAKLKANSHASLAYKAQPQEIVYRGTGTPENYARLYNDAHAAYQLGLRWKIEGNTSYADAAAKILDGWSSTLKSVDGSSDKFLAVGIYGYQLANAAEILRDYDGWTGLKATQTLLLKVFYPMNHNFLVNHNDAKIDHYWANWDQCNIAAIQAIGILTDNQTMYNEAVNYYKSGAGNGNIGKSIWKLYSEAGSGKSLGQGQEAGRDQGHALLGFGWHGAIAQQAWNQGDDLFGYLNNRILAGAEYVSKYNLGHEVPYTTYTNSDVTQTEISAAGRGGMRPIWELLYAHYGVQKGLNASWVQQYRDLTVKNGSGAEGGGGDYGPNSGGYDALGFGTLMFRLK